MTTSPGWEPRPGPTQGETARRAPRGAAGDWPDGPAGRRGGGPVGPVGAGARNGYDPRGRGPRRPEDLRGRPSGASARPGSGGRPGQAEAAGPDGPRPAPLLRWLGHLSTRNALLALAAGTLVGIAGTLATGSEPGFLLAFFITLGAVVGALGVRRGAVYLFFPLPPFAFFVGAVITGKVHDSSLSSSTVGLSAGLLQWIAYIFFPMCVATVLVLLIGGIRWGLGLMLVGGQFPMSDDRPAGPRGARPRTAPGPRTDVDPWADPNARVRRQAVADDPRQANADPRPANGDPRAASGQSAPRPGSAPWLGPDGARSAAPRPARDPRGDRDPWGDPRSGPAADRRPPTRNAPPPAAPKPSFQPRPASPGDRAPRPPGPQRPVRPPGDSWDRGY
jgi:hypothetical protein